MRKIPQRRQNFLEIKVLMGPMISILNRWLNQIMPHAGIHGQNVERARATSAAKYTTRSDHHDSMNKDIFTHNEWKTFPEVYAILRPFKDETMLLQGRTKTVIVVQHGRYYRLSLSFLTRQDRSHGISKPR